MMFNRKNLKLNDLRRKSRNIYKRNYFIISFVLLIILDGSLEYDVHVWPVYIVYIDCSNKNWTFLKDMFSCTRAQQVLGYHLIKIPCLLLHM